MGQLLEQILAYLQTLNFTFTLRLDDFIVAETPPGVGGSKDQWLIWTPQLPDNDEDIPLLERRLLREVAERKKRYANSRLWIVADTFGGFSQKFRSEMSQNNANLRVPIQFFDMEFKYEVLSGIQSPINVVSKSYTRIVPQPYSLIFGNGNLVQGDDLQAHLLSEFQAINTSKLRIVVGPAGIGKSALFNSLFTSLYEYFKEQKLAQEMFPRPIPFLPEHLRRAGVLRTKEVLNAFINTEIAIPVFLPTLEWMARTGYAIWMFDGLDELYAEDPEFFPYLMELLTHPHSQAQVLVCVRESLLRSSESFVEFISDYGNDPVLQVYRLEGWELPSKQIFAHRKIIAPSDEKRFLNYISSSDALRELSGLPFYLNLLLGEFEASNQTEFDDDSSLIGYAVTSMIERELEKGVLKPEDFRRGQDGIFEWLMAIAYEYYLKGSEGIKITDLDIYAGISLNSGLSDEEQENVVTALYNFWVFSPGVEVNTLTFEHELIAEYLAGNYWINYFKSDPMRYAMGLSQTSDFINRLVSRHIAGQLDEEGQEVLASLLRSERLQGASFTNLLHLILLASKSPDVPSNYNIIFENRDLSHLKFIGRNLEGISFKGSTLTNTVFDRCRLHNTEFDGATLIGTYFSNIGKSDLVGARFGTLSKFESVYIDNKIIEDRLPFSEWTQKMTGYSEPVLEPCPSALQLKTLFSKFVRSDGTGRRDELPIRALLKGKQHPSAPPAKDIVETSLRFGYLQETRWHDRIRRVPGDKYNEMIDFVTNWQISEGINQILDTVCSNKGCEHIPHELRGA